MRQASPGAAGLVAEDGDAAVGHETQALVAWFDAGQSALISRQRYLSLGAEFGQDFLQSSKGKRKKEKGRNKSRMIAWTVVSIHDVCDCLPIPKNAIPPSAFFLRSVNTSSNSTITHFLLPLPRSFLLPYFGDNGRGLHFVSVLSLNLFHECLASSRAAVALVAARGLVREGQSQSIRHPGQDSGTIR